jgi:hypothetical protein
MPADLSFANHGSLFVLSANTDTGRDWIAEHIPGDAQTWCGGIVVEPRYAGDIANGAMGDGLTVD